MTQGWTTPAELREQLVDRWQRGWLPARLVEAGEEFPLRLALRAPKPAEWSERFEEVRDWAAKLQQGTPLGYRLVHREVRHRVLGANALPAEAWVDTLDDALRLAGKQREARRFALQVALTREREPALLPWLQRHPIRAAELAPAWPLLLDLVAWLQANPRPGIYLRQVDLPGLHSKFIESHRAVLAELFDRCVPPQAIDNTAQGAAQFARRYGFRDKPLRLRFRWLHGGADRDITLTAAAFATLHPLPSRVFVTENEINFLAFPECADSLVVFGAGYGLDAAARAHWLAERPLHYWGDIDTHGFAMLDQWRACFAHTRSLLMDRATLLEHEAQWVDESAPTSRELVHLGAEDRRLYDDLRDRRLADRAIRLEQERIRYGRVEQALQAAAAST